MTIMEETRTREDPRSAHEINRRVRQIEMDRVLLEVTGRRKEIRREGEPVGAFPGATGEAQLLTRRGRQRTPKPWLRAVLCRLGMHHGQWAFVAEGNCAQGRECGRCGSVHVRARHRREWCYLRESTCEQVRKCGRCSDANSERTSHEWGEDYDIETRWWQGSKEGHRCLRCGAEEEWHVDCGD